MESVISGIIGGIFTIAGVWYGHYLQTRQVNSAPAPLLNHQADASPLPKSVSQSIEFASVVRDVGIIMLLTFAGGIVVGLSAGNIGDINEIIGAIVFSNLFFSALGFTISGSLVKNRRWRHLLYVAVGVWVVSIINIATIEIEFGMWLLSIIPILFTMAVGGCVSYLFNRPSTATA